MSDFYTESHYGRITSSQACRSEHLLHAVRSLAVMNITSKKLANLVPWSLLAMRFPRIFPNFAERIRKNCNTCFSLVVGGEPLTQAALTEGTGFGPSHLTLPRQDCGIDEPQTSVK
jgi:hypothetical protein